MYMHVFCIFWLSCIKRQNSFLKIRMYERSEEVTVWFGQFGYISAAL